MMSFSQQFKAFIDDKHLDLPSIAREMGLSNARRLHSIAKGTSSMTVDELKKFCEVTNINSDDLVFYLKN